MVDFLLEYSCVVIEQWSSSVFHPFSITSLRARRSNDSQLSFTVDTQFTDGSTSFVGDHHQHEQHDEESRIQRSTVESVVLRSNSHHASGESAQFQDALIQRSTLV